MQVPGEHSSVWTERLRVHSYDADFSHRASVPSLCKLFVEAAWRHAEQLGVGFRQLSAQRRFWVLSRMAVEVERYPSWGEEVTLVTWPRDAGSIFALRDFEILSANGGRLVGGSSAWLVLDARTRRPQRMKPIAASIPALTHKSALNQDPEKLDPVKNGRQEMKTTAHYSAVDVNGHVNSVNYVSWILDSYPLEFHRAHCVRSLQINFLCETLGGEEISVLTAKDRTGVFHHSIVKSAGQETCRALMRWEEVSPCTPRAPTTG